MATTLNAPIDRQVLVRRALWLAALTVGWNVVEGVTAMGLGVSDESLALFGFGVDSFVEVGAALLVFWRLRGEGGRGALPDRQRERRATASIGVLLMVLAGGVLLGSIAQLAQGNHPESTLGGVVVSLLSIGLMMWLWRSKRSVATALDSRTLAADAACSRSCLQLSFVLLAGSALYVVAPALWWVDAAASLALAVLIGREGWGTLQAARAPEFTGSCGCHGGCD